MTSSPRPAITETPDPADADAYHRRLVHQAYGAGARIRLLQKAPSFGAPVFVIDLDDGPRHVRLLGAFKSAIAAPDDDPKTIVLSAMDLIYPARLELEYERLMSFAFALCDQPAKALVLGGGGAEMWRFVRAYLPDCAMTQVESNETIAAIARRWFYLDQRVVIDDGERFLADTTEQFDVVLIDLSDAHGSAALNPDFWAHCLDALAPGGCITANWPYTDDERTKIMAETQAEMARGRGLDCFFISPRDRTGNIVQFLSTADRCSPDTISGAIKRFAEERRIPEAVRPNLDDCVISTNFPVAA